MEVKLIKLKYNSDWFDISLNLTAYCLTLHSSYQVTVGQEEKVSLPAETEEREEQEVSLDSVYQGDSLRTNTSGFQGKGVTVPRAGTEELGVPEDTGQGRLYCRKRVKRTTLLTIIYRQMKKTF